MNTWRLADPEVTQPQTQHLAASEPTEHHGRDHRPVPCVRSAAIKASTSAGDKIRGNWRATRTSGTP